MKQLMFVRVNGHLFWRKRNTPVLTYGITQCRNYFTVVKTIQETRNELPKKPILVPKKVENFQLLRKFSSDFQNENVLMDFDVWPHTPFLKAIKNFYYFHFAIKKIDQNFSLEEFVRSANLALQVVTTLLSELRFSELEGLLTPECKEEVEKNIKFWSKNQISSLAFKPEQVWGVSPGETVIFSDAKNKERLFVEIRLIHYIFIKSPISLDNSDFFRSFIHITQFGNSDNVFVCGIFNSRFIREYTEGVNDQWTINAINVKYFSNMG